MWVHIQNSWGDVRTIKYVKISYISRNVSKIKRIVYTSTCIGLVRIVKIESEYNIDERYPRHIFNDDDEVFCNQL